LVKLFKQNWFAYLPLEPFPPCPNSMIEAITYGIPVIASSSGSNPEILENSNLIFNVPFKWKDDLSNFEIDEFEIKEKLFLLDNNWDFFYNYSIEISKKFETKKILNYYLKFIFSEKSE
jgi:glycosyltransferase involved in cell wall biosynthesis